MFFSQIALANESATPAVSFSVLDLVLQSGPVVFSVLLLLLAFSVVSWAIIWTKWKLLGKTHIISDEFLDVFWSGRSLDHVYSESKKFELAPVAKVFQSGYKELQKLLDRQKEADFSPESSLHNLERALTSASRKETLKLEGSMTFLATTASSAPFIGLFGTVWGIMGAFQNIGVQGAASLAVVAPSISEALIATAVGLFAAIPASMGYNYFNSKIRNQKIQMENFSGDFLNISKRKFISS